MAPNLLKMICFFIHKIFEILLSQDDGEL